MIQELLGGAALIGGERKISINGTILEGTPPSSSSPPSLSPSSTTTATTATASSATNSSTSTSENLRCPRCDSSNTKFCYYNNYNLTQPRHFCKTCRRYWTKGGALRNVPIGGGCRKNKSTSSASASVGKSSSGKIKPFASEIGRSAGFGSGFDPDFASSPILWASPHNSHLLALLRGDQNPNPSGLPSSIGVKHEGSMIGIGTQVIAEPAVATGALNARFLGSEHFSQQSSLGLCSSPFWKSGQHLQAQQQPQNGFLVGGDPQNSGLQELYQRLKSSTSYYNDSSPVVLGNVAAASSTSSSSSTILESSPVVGGELGYWNPAFSWSDLPN